MRQRLLGVLVVSVGLSLSSGALAQAPKGDADTAWRAKFDAGREALRAKRVKEALALFQESWALNKTAGTMLNIGTCEEQLGQPASAWKHFKEALEMLPAKDERVPTVKQWVERVEPHVPRLRIRLDKGAPAGTKVNLGDRAVESGAMDTDLPMDPGAYTIRVSAKGFVTRTYEIKLEDGEKEVAVVTPGAPDSPRPTADVAASSSSGPPATSGSILRPALLIGGGVMSAGLLATGAGLLAVTEGKTRELQLQVDDLTRTYGVAACRNPPTAPVVACKSNLDGVMARDAMGNAAIGAIAAGGTIAALTLSFRPSRARRRLP